MIRANANGGQRTRAIGAVRIVIVAIAAAGAAYLGGFSPAQAVTVSSKLYISICGDGIIETGEVCDDGPGNNIGGYGPTFAQRHCNPDCQSYGPYCGDGILQVRFGEQCDQGAANGGGGLCSATCQTLPPSPPAGNPTTGSPAVGSIPEVPEATPGTIPSDTATKVVLRGKAYPNSTVNILLDGQTFGSVQADSNADFLYTNTAVTPGIATFSFSAVDGNGIPSLTDSVVFDVVQGAVTTVANIFLPPTISVSATQIAPGGLLTISGQSVPFANVTTQIDTQASSTLISPVDVSGTWALQLNTASIATGNHAVKAYFQLGTSTQSGFGRSVSFVVGSGSSGCSASPDLNGDKKVNLVDFSIFLTFWDTAGPQGDFNCDGKVNLADFSIMLFNWTG